MANSVRIAIIGAGFGGLGAAIRLKQLGHNDFVVLEKASDVGGTWRANTYPGCACDVPSHLYSFSFALNPEWSQSFSPQPEIWAYLQKCAAHYGITPHLRFGAEVTSAIWDESTSRWQITTGAGDYDAEVLIVAGGPLSDPAVPALPGLETFEGPAFHSARWDHSYDLAGKRVAVVGTGASAVQFVPEIQPRVASLTLFQRTAAWVMPRRQRHIKAGERAIFRAVPPAQRVARVAIYWAREMAVMGFRHPRMMGALAQRIAARNLREGVPDPELRAKLTPNFTMGCKRVLISNDYYPALGTPNTTVVTEPIVEVRPHAVVTGDGVEHPADAIIFGTGFHVTEVPAAKFIRGRGGVTLEQAWAGSMNAYLGITVSGFPNLFLLLGPNSGLGHNSVVFMIEAELVHVVKALRYLSRSGVAAIEPRREAQDRYTAMIDRKMRGTVWTAGGCNSWYLDSTGRNSTLWPSFSFTYRMRARRFKPADYTVITRATSEVPV